MIEILTALTLIIIVILIISASTIDLELIEKQKTIKDFNVLRWITFIIGNTLIVAIIIIVLYLIGFGVMASINTIR